MDAQIADAEMQIHIAGFDPALYSTGSWEAAPVVFEPQRLAALQIFQWFFTAHVQRVWVHLAAEMQAGKTGVIDALVRLILRNFTKIRISPDRIFIVTGMNDKAWCKQTRERMVDSIRANVHHSGKINRVIKDLKALAERAPLSNILIVIDESHIATKEGNRPNQIYNTVKELCDPSLWAERGIHFVTISATDPSKIIAITDDGMRHSTKVVRLHTTDGYQSIQTLLDARRIRYADTFGDLHTAKAITELRRVILTEYVDGPRYHILRPRQSKQEAVNELLKRALPNAIIYRWDGDTKGSGSGAEDESSTMNMDDINDLLSVAPVQHTFIILKNMLYAAKTLNDTYVGVLYDRVGGKDDTNMQSLLGRACGYGKSKRTIVYTSQNTVKNYLALWRDVCLGEKPSDNIPLQAKDLDRKMAAVKARVGAGGAGTCRLEIERRTAMPLKSSAQEATEAARAASIAANQEKMEVPLVIESVPDDYFTPIMGRGAAERRQKRIRDLLFEADPENEFNAYLREYRSLGVETPGTTGAIQRKILAPITAQAEGRKYILDVHEEDRGDNVWLAKLDPANKRVVIMVWHGARE